MKTHVLLVDDDASRSAERRHYLAGARVEVMNACEAHEAIELLQSHRVDVVCIHAQFVVNCGSEIGAFFKCLKPFVPVVLIADDNWIPRHVEERVDIVIDRTDFDVAGRRLVQELNQGHVLFFRRWFDEWADRASKSERGITHMC